MKTRGLKIAAVLLVFMLLTLTGCRKYEQIRITSLDVESVNMNGFKAVDLTLKVEIDNPAGKVVVKTAEGTLKHFGKVVGKVTLDPLTLMPRSNAEYSVIAHVELSSGLGFRDILSLVDPKKWDDYTVDISVSGKAAGVAVKRNINDIPLKKLLEAKEYEKV